MSTGCCLTCRVTGRIERDHPTGRVRGQPLHPGFTVELCPACHHEKGLADRAAHVEGGEPTVRLVLARLATFFAWLAEHERPVCLSPVFFSGLAAVLEDLSWQSTAEAPR